MSLIWTYCANENVVDLDNQASVDHDLHCLQKRLYILTLHDSVVSIFLESK